MRRFSWIVFAAFLAACGSSAASTPSSAPAASPAATQASSAPATEATSPPAEQATAAPRATASTDAPTTAAGTGSTGIALQMVNDQLTSPVFATHAGDGSGRLFVIEKTGTIAILKDGQRTAAPFLDISSLITDNGSEQGLLGLAFHPKYSENGIFFVYYTASNGDNTLARYKVSSSPDAADPSSGVVMFKQEDPAPNHNGGMLAFGPDGYLYVGLGDGGGAGDTYGNAQNRNTLLGKLLRLDVDKGDPYAIPTDNPWPEGGDARPEIWAYGLRNPWRFSFDRDTGDLYVGDVGQNQYEEIDMQPAGAKGGTNYGWNTREAMHCFRSNSCASDGLVDPVAEYSHDEGCSVTGGYVYRGTAMPGMVGTYLYGDYCSGTIWGLRRDAGGQWQASKLLSSGTNLSSFGEDQDGELYVVDLSGKLYRIVGA